jgi:hypothetical protein
MAETREREWVFKVPDFASMTTGELKVWVSAFHPGSQVMPSFSSA